MSKRFASLLHGSRAAIAAGLVVALTGSTAAAISADKVTFKDLSPGLKKLIRSKTGTGRDGAQGAQGQTGQTGATGSAGAAGSNAVFNASNWSAIPRNNIGSPYLELQDGPHGSFGVTGPEADPPFGTGSLGIGVNDVSGKVEKAAFGNETDFTGDPVLGVDQVGFHAFQTGENAGISARNLPNITFEIDSNIDAAGPGTVDDYTSLVFVPAAAAFSGGGSWTGYLDGTTTGNWYMTGGEGTRTGCTTSLTCDFNAVMTALDDGGTAPVIYTAAVGKGRDNAWFGAVDGLRINNTIYDFEPLGVVERAP